MLRNIIFNKFKKKRENNAGKYNNKEWICVYSLCKLSYIPKTHNFFIFRKFDKLSKMWKHIVLLVNRYFAWMKKDMCEKHKECVT